MLGGGLRRLLPRVALVNVGQGHGLARDGLHLLGQGCHPGPVLLIGWPHQRGQQVSGRVNVHVHLAAFAAFSPVIACPMATSRGTLQRAAVE